MLLGQKNRPEFSLTSVARALWKRKWLVGAFWAATSALAILIVSHMQPLYSAESLVLVESQKIPENYVAATVHVELSERLDRLKQEVLSYDRLLQLMRQYKLYRKSWDKRPEIEIVSGMRENIGITLERTWSADRPGAFRVSYVGSDPVTTAAVVNQISRFFVDENQRGRQMQAEGTSEFLESQLVGSKKNLEIQEGRLKQYKLAHNGELPQQESALIASLGQGKSELQGIQQELSRAQQNKMMLKNALTGIAEIVRLRELMAKERMAAVVAAGQQKLNPPPVKDSERLRASLNALRSRYGDKHPDVERVEAQLAAAEATEAAEHNLARKVLPQPEARVADRASLEDLAAATAAEQERIGELNAQLAATDNQINDLEASEKRVLVQNHEVEAHLLNLPIREQQLATVVRDYDISKLSYHALLEKKLAADVASNMEKRHQAQRFTILEEARIPEAPIRPRRALLSFGGSLAGLFAGLVIGLALELKEDVFLGEWELPAGSVILARVPQMEGLAL
jgi:succinoglycan biosynthesis transport protein ExoP